MAVASSAGRNGAAGECVQLVADHRTGGSGFFDTIDLMGGAELVVDEFDETRPEVLERRAVPLRVGEPAPQSHHPSVGSRLGGGRHTDRRGRRVECRVHQVGDEPQPDADQDAQTLPTSTMSGSMPPTIMRTLTAIVIPAMAATGRFHDLMWPSRAG